MTFYRIRDTPIDGFCIHIVVYVYRISKIDVVGFGEALKNHCMAFSAVVLAHVCMYAAMIDYDYTLCHYTKELQHLIYSMAREYLVRC
jgi:hypothetical protein